MAELKGRGFVGAITSRESNGKTYRSATIVDTATGRADQFEVHHELNGELDAQLHNEVEFTARYARYWNDRTNLPSTVVRIVSVEPVAA